LDLQWNQQAVRNEGPIRARYERQVLDIEQASITALDSRLTVKGRLPLREAAFGRDRSLARLDLATLARYVPSPEPITAKGTATIDGNIRGTLRSIDPSLEITLKEGSFHSRKFGPPIANVNVAAAVRDGAIKIETASAGWASATVNVSGTAPLALLQAALPFEMPRRPGPAQLTASKGSPLSLFEGVPRDYRNCGRAPGERHAP
jgi:hypothetical protein